MRSGSFCRIYIPIPASEGDGDAILRNEMRHCVMCRPDCPEAVVEAWKERGGS